MLIKRLNENTSVGTKVIVRSNNDEPYMIGVFSGYELKENSSPIPVCICNDTTYWVMGIVVEHNDELQTHLDSMTPKDQWNYLSLNYKRK